MLTCGYINYNYVIINALEGINQYKTYYNMSQYMPHVLEISLSGERFKGGLSG